VEHVTPHNITIGIANGKGVLCAVLANICHAIIEELVCRVEAGWNASTVALRVVKGDGKGTQCPGVYLGHPVPGGYKYGDLALQVGESQELGK
jgi:hypothetical protein